MAILKKSQRIYLIRNILRANKYMSLEIGFRGFDILGTTQKMATQNASEAKIELSIYMIVIKEEICLKLHQLRSLSDKIAKFASTLNS